MIDYKKACYFAKSDEALKNGSFIVLYRTSYSRYMNGDFAGSTEHRNGYQQGAQIVSEGYKAYTRKEVKQVTGR